MLQARNRALNFSKLLSVLVNNLIVDDRLLHECLYRLLAEPYTLRMEAAAELLYLTQPQRGMGLSYARLQQFCTAGLGLAGRDAQAAAVILVSLTCGLRHQRQQCLGCVVCNHRVDP